MKSPVVLCGAGVLCLCALVVLRQLKKELAPVLSAVCACLFLPAGLWILREYLSYYMGLAQESSYSGYFDLLFKALGIGVLSSAVGSLCRDCGEPSLGERLEFCCRCSILALSLPVTKDLLSFAMSLL